VTGVDQGVVAGEHDAGGVGELCAEAVDDVDINDGDRWRPASDERNRAQQG
jgi:hypothetical protein